jgi:peptidyl-dipeptidase Dcp
MNLQDITIRTKIQPGDLGYVIHRHGVLYNREYEFGVIFETYVGKGIFELYKNYDVNKDCVWICEHGNQIIGFLALEHKESETAQLRYFFIEPEYRGIGLGKKLMQLYMEFLKAKNYKRCFLWTVSELDAALSLYQKHGFVLSEEVESDTFGKLVTEQRYDLTLQ